MGVSRPRQHIVFLCIIFMAIARIQQPGSYFPLFFKFPLYQKVFEIVTRPLFILSGVFYVPTHMPHPFAGILLANPITQVVVLFREGFYVQHGDTGLDMPFLITTSVALLFVGMFLFTVFPVARARD